MCRVFLDHSETQERQILIVKVEIQVLLVVSWSQGGSYLQFLKFPHRKIVWREDVVAAEGETRSQLSPGSAAFHCSAKKAETGVGL